MRSRLKGGWDERTPGPVSLGPALDQPILRLTTRANPGGRGSVTFTGAGWRWRNARSMAGLGACLPCVEPEPRRAAGGPRAGPWAMTTISGSDGYAPSNPSIRENLCPAGWRLDQQRADRVRSAFMLERRQNELPFQRTTQGSDNESVRTWIAQSYCLWAPYGGRPASCARSIP